jgi:surface polysaccharide O-acyltransferase-like enzyme
VLGLIGGSLFAISCGASSFAFLGLFLKVVHQRRAIFDSLSDNEYGMYLIHYMFVSWLQFALLRADLPAIVKMPLVFTGVLALSWMSVAAMRRIPMVRRVT